MRLRAALVVLSAVPILVATLYPAGDALRPGWTLWFAGDEATAELLQNLLLFIPFGAALALAGRRPRTATLLGAGLSFAVEFAQQWIPGRDPNVGDLVTNTLSTAIGAAVVWTAPRWLLVSPARAARQALGLAALAAGAWLGTAWLLVHRGAMRTLLLEELPRTTHTVGDGWRLIFFPDSFPLWSVQLLDAAWLGGWTLLIGFWARATTQAFRWVAVLAVTTALGALFVVPRLTGLAPTPALEIAGALTGLAAGAGLRRLTQPAHRSPL